MLVSPAFSLTFSYPRARQLGNRESVDDEGREMAGTGTGVCRPVVRSELHTKLCRTLCPGDISCPAGQVVVQRQ